MTLKAALCGLSMLRPSWKWRSVVLWPSLEISKTYLYSQILRTHPKWSYWLFYAGLPPKYVPQLKAVGRPACSYMLAMQRFGAS